jgi:hypothetical protein
MIHLGDLARLARSIALPRLRRVPPQVFDAKQRWIGPRIGNSGTRVEFSIFKDPDGNQFVLSSSG